MHVCNQLIARLSALHTTQQIMPPAFSGGCLIWHLPCRPWQVRTQCRRRNGPALGTTQHACTACQSLRDGLLRTGCAEPDLATAGGWVQVHAVQEENLALRSDNGVLAAELDQMNRVASYVGSRVARVLAGARGAQTTTTPRSSAN